MRQSGRLDEAGNPETYGTFVYPKDRLPTDEGNGWPQDGGFLDPSNLAGTVFGLMSAPILGAGFTGMTGLTMPSFTDFLPEGFNTGVKDFLGTGLQVDAMGNPLDIAGGGGANALAGGMEGDFLDFDTTSAYETPDWSGSTGGGSAAFPAEVDNWDLMGDTSLLNPTSYSGAVPPYDSGGYGDYASMGGDYMNTGSGTGAGGGLTDFLKSGLGKTLLALGPAAIGAWASSNQADALREISDQNRGDRAPYLNQSKEWLTNPEAFYSGPGKGALEANLRALSAKFGNPIDSPTALGIATDAGMKNWMNAVQGLGSIGLGGQGIQSQLQMNAIGSDANVLNALGAGLRDLSRGDEGTLEQVLNKLAQSGNLKLSLT